MVPVQPQPQYYPLQHVEQSFQAKLMAENWCVVRLYSDSKVECSKKEMWEGGLEVAFAERLVWSCLEGMRLGVEGTVERS
jgi:hypothetical protein